MERAMGIEPTSKAWEAFILPMNYARAVFPIVTPCRGICNRFFLRFSVES